MPDLQINAADNGNGLIMPVLGYSSVSFVVSGTFSATVNPEGSADGGATWVPLTVNAYGSATTATTITTAGTYQSDCAGLGHVRARISGYVSGSVLVSALATTGETGAGGSGGGGGGAITATQLPAALGQTTMAGSLSTTIASDQPSIGVIPDPTENHLGSVGSNTARIYINPTITAGAYSAGDVVGGRLTLTNWARVSALGTRLLGVHIVDVSNVKADLDLLLFDSLPTANIADNGAWVWNSADYDNCIMHFAVLATEYTSVGSVALCSKSLSGFPVLPAGSANVYLYIVCRGTPTYASTADLHISFKPDRD